MKVSRRCWFGLLARVAVVSMASVPTSGSTKVREKKYAG